MVQGQPMDWRKLCETASTEEDPEKLSALVAQINFALDEAIGDARRPSEHGRGRKTPERASQDDWAIKQEPHK
jgi:hypothetical protein